MTERVARPFTTIGHSNRSLAQFCALLAQAGVRQVVDVRKMPRSRANPQFNGDRLAVDLAARGIGYTYAAALGGLRGRNPQVPPVLNGRWTNRSFHHYADYALSGAFRAGLERLIEDGRAQACTVMCAEAVWWRCHRRIIADYLLARGEQVLHIMGDDRLLPARLTDGAMPQADGTIHYPALVDIDVDG